MVTGEVRLRLLPQLVVVLALDDLPTHAVDSPQPLDLLHQASLGNAAPPPPGVGEAIADAALARS